MGEEKSAQDAVQWHESQQQQQVFSGWGTSCQPANNIFPHLSKNSLTFSNEPQLPLRAADEQQLWESACFQINVCCSKAKMLAEKHPEKYSTYPEAFYSFY